MKISIGELTDITTRAIKSYGYDDQFCRMDNKSYLPIRRLPMRFIWLIEF